jgi:alcohol dehydrogenase class IV
LPGWAAEAHAIRRLMDNNPRDMTVAEIEAIYRAAF